MVRKGRASGREGSKRSGWRARQQVEEEEEEEEEEGEEEEGEEKVEGGGKSVVRVWEAECEPSLGVVSSPGNRWTDL